MNLHSGCTTVVIFWALVVSVNTSAQEIADQGRNLATACMQCHGTGSLYGEARQFMAPKLGGQSSEYIVRSLIAYLTGMREDRSLHRGVSSLQLSDILKVAEFYENQRTQASTDVGISKTLGDANVEQAARPNSYNDEEYDRKKIACVACHSRDGNHPQSPEYPVLAGQHREYLMHALRGYRTGKRQNAEMLQVVQSLQLSETDIQRMARHYSDEQGLVSVSKEAVPLR